MFRRKIEEQLLDWKKSTDKMPMVIKGCRQCGKTSSVLDFAYKNYKNVVYLDFFQNPEYKAIFDGSLEIDNILMNISTLVPSANMLEQGTAADILGGNLMGYKGAIFENLIADVFGKMGRKLYYFRKDSGLEVDFVMRYMNECVLVEVKATSGNVKSTKTILAHPEKYHVRKAIKLGNYNIGVSGSVTTLPLYMAFFLKC